MAEILLVEDSKFFASLVMRRFFSVEGYTVHWAQSFEEARAFIEDDTYTCAMAFLDLNLPDAPHGEVVDWFVYKGIPSIVFTGGFDDKARDTILSKNVVDYVVKESEDCLDSLVESVQRIERNKTIKVMVVDDSTTARNFVARMLAVHQYQVIKAEGGTQALEMLTQHPDTKVVITDYNMPDMDGFELTKTIRKKHSKDVLAVIGMSAQGNDVLSARFIKAGANDFLNKPFLTEEFYCRVAQNVEILEYIETIRALSYTDPMTGLANRRLFFEKGPVMFRKAGEEQLPIVVAMADIDHFKRVNDTYGHDSGDQVIKMVAHELKDRFGGDGLVSRFGGEEFCVLLVGEQIDQVVEKFEAFRATIENTVLEHGEFKLNCTVSVGLCPFMAENLDQMVVRSDDALYEAKESGRNRVIMASE